MSKLATRIYAVRANNAQTRLVRAATHARALRHCIDDTYVVEIASQDECIRLASAGVQVEEAGADDAAGEAAP